jgi:hypothetical protein
MPRLRATGAEPISATQRSDGMPRINTQQNTSKVFALLETDIYRMVIKKADVEADKYAEPDENGNLPDKIVLIWEVYEATEDQDESVVGMSVWQRMAPWYGTSKRGPSPFKMLIDSLLEQEMITEFDPEDFDTDVLVGVKQRVNIEKYIKTMGPNKGEDGNRVVGGPMPLTRKKLNTTTKTVTPARKNVPVAVEVGDDGEIPF